MVWLIMILALGAAVVLENAVPAWHLGGQTRLPAVLCVVMYYALNHSLVAALAAALVAGVMADAISGLPPGSTPLAFSLLVAAVSRNRGFVFIRQWLTHMVIGAAAGAALMLIMYGVLCLRLEQMRAVPPAMAALKMLGAGLQGMLLMPWVFMALEGLEKMTGCRRSLIGDEFGIFDKT